MFNISQLESSLWEAADQLRANSKLNANEYSMPVLGLIFLRHATNRFKAVKVEIEKTLPSRGGKKRPITKDDFKGKAAIFLPEEAQYDFILNLPESADIGTGINAAMKAIEDETQMLRGVLPKDYTSFEPELLYNLVRIFDREELRTATGDVFGRIYEYFLNKFAMSGAQEGGEFFTPPSLVRTIVNMIEPDRGIILDPACPSAGMFVQTGHFLENRGDDAAAKMTFYGQEKSDTNTRLARMNLAVHALEGTIRQGNSFYDRWEELLGRGQQERYLGLVQEYLNKTHQEAGTIEGALTQLEEPLAKLMQLLQAFCGDVTCNVSTLLKELPQAEELVAEDIANQNVETFRASLSELEAEIKEFATARQDLIGKLQVHLAWFAQKNPTPTPPLGKGRGDLAPAKAGWGFATNEAQKDCATRFALFIPQLKTLQKHINEVHKLGTRAVELAEKKLDARKQESWDAKEIKKQRDVLDVARDTAISAIKSTLYVKAQVTWLQTRFPEAVFVDVPGLCKVVTRDEILQQDCSLTPGRYVGVTALDGEDEDDFEERMREIHLELASLNEEAVELAASIAANFEELGL